MFNADIPSRAELPTTRQLIRSTVLALAAAAVLLVTVVLPAEYAIDPTGIGRALKLTEMGAIKKQLAIEAETDRQRDRPQGPAPSPAAAPERRSGLPALLGGFLISSAAAHPHHGDEDGEDQIAPARRPPAAMAQQAPDARTDELVFKLKPNEGIEYKMTMLRGARAEFSWRVEGGVVNYDMHGTPKGGGKETSYKKGNGAGSEAGVLTADYDGSHGWFWRNRGTREVTITLKTSGAYSEIRRMN